MDYTHVILIHGNELGFVITDPASGKTVTRIISGAALNMPVSKYLEELNWQIADIKKQIEQKVGQFAGR